MNPFEFEKIVAQMLRSKAWTDVNLTSKTVDKGRDIIGTNKKGQKVYVNKQDIWKKGLLK